MPCRLLTSVFTCVWLAAYTAIPLQGQTPASEDNWPRFRGPDAGVVDDDPALPERWSTTENVTWKVDLPGAAWGSPIVWGDQVFVTTVISDEPRPEPDLDPRAVQNPHTGGLLKQEPLSTPYRWVLYAIDFDTGAVDWERELRQGIPEGTKHSKNSYASETPVTDGERVYVYHANAGLFAVDVDGTLVWSREVELPPAPSEVSTESSPVLNKIREELPDASGGAPPRTLAGSYFMGVGQAASPALHGGRIFVTADHESLQWFLVAFDAATGDELWRVVEPKEVEAYGWSTPFVWEHDLRTEIITAGNNRVRSYDPDGTLLWELRGLSASTTPTPFSANGLLYVASGYPADTFRPVYAIRPGGSGDISLTADATSNEYVAWFKRSAGGYMPSALVYDDCYYTLYSQGFLTCHHAVTGREVYGRTRIARGAAAFTASPWAYNGKIFAASEDGDTYVLDSGPEYKLLGKNSLDEMVLATPAIVRGSLFIRTVSSLWRIAKSGR